MHHQNLVSIYMLSSHNYKLVKLQIVHMCKIKKYLTNHLADIVPVLISYCSYTTQSTINDGNDHGMWISVLKGKWQIFFTDTELIMWIISNETLSLTEGHGNTALINTPGYPSAMKFIRCTTECYGDQLHKH